MGGSAAYLGFNGYQTSTINFQTFSQVAFAFAGNAAALFGSGIGIRAHHGPGRRADACIRAARLPIASALRQL